MAPARIPVDLFNPGQVFACLGFLEAADVLIGEAQGGFDWRDTSDVRFVLRARGETNPVETVLAFLAEAKLSRCAPTNYRDPLPKAAKTKGQAAAVPDVDNADIEVDRVPLIATEHFRAPEGDRMSLPIRLEGAGGVGTELGHWADESSRDSFKLYAGNRSAAGIAAAMLLGLVDKKGRVDQQGVVQLWGNSRRELIERPFEVLTPIRGSFNFDPRSAWTAIDAGYSPNDQGHSVASSPVMQMLAAWGLENARPEQYTTRKVRYAAWGIELVPMLARAALVGAIPAIPSKRFGFELALSGKNKIVKFANLESNP